MSEAPTPATRARRRESTILRYYIRQLGKHVSGPHDLAEIKAWVKAGKVRQEMEFSTDGKDWMLGLEMAELFPMKPSRPRRPVRRRRRSA